MSSPRSLLRAAPDLISFVIPVMNEEEVLPELRARLEKLALTLPGECEWLFVDDGSSDRTAQMLFEWSSIDERVKVLRFSRNFGHQAAITAGLDYADGDVVVIMDADLQDPPELAIDMVAKYREGFDVVYAQRVNRAKESRFKRFSAWAFYRIMRRFVDSRLPADTGDFRLMTSDVVTAVRAMREGHRFLRGMISWVGFRQTSVPFERAPRFSGQTKFPFMKMMRFAIDGMLSFSTLPLRAGIFLGGMLFLGSFGYVAVAVARKLMGHSLAWGWTSLMTLQCFIGGAILISVGIVGEYVGRIYEENKARPMYIVAELAGLAPEIVRERTVLPRVRPTVKPRQKVSRLAK